MKKNNNNSTEKNKNKTTYKYHFQFREKQDINENKIEIMLKKIKKYTPTINIFMSVKRKNQRWKSGI